MKKGDVYYINYKPYINIFEDGNRKIYKRRVQFSPSKDNGKLFVTMHSKKVFLDELEYYLY